MALYGTLEMACLEQSPVSTGLRMDRVALVPIFRNPLGKCVHEAIHQCRRRTSSPRTPRTVIT